MEDYTDRIRGRQLITRAGLWQFISLCSLLASLFGCAQMETTPSSEGLPPPLVATTPYSSPTNVSTPTKATATETPQPSASSFIPTMVPTMVPTILTPTKTITLRPTRTERPTRQSAAELRSTILARTLTAYTSLFIQKNLAFLGYGENLIILDISTPNNPTTISKTFLQNPIKKIQVIENYVYVVVENHNSGDLEAGLHIIDINDPFTPIKRSFYTPEFLARDIVVDGETAYAVGATGAWDVIDVSDPVHPVKINTIQEVPSLWDCHGGGVVTYGIEVEANFLHLFRGSCRSGGRGIGVYDTSNALNPVQIGGLPGLDVAYHGNYAYTFASYAGTFLRIYNISDWTKPGITGDVSIPRPRYSLQAGKLVVIERYVYVATSEGLYVIDTVDRNRPQIVNTLYPTAYFSDVVETNGYLYILDWDNGLRILDISDPVNLMEVGSWQQ